MLQVDVYIGEGIDADHPGRRILVSQSPAAMHTGDEVIWHIHSIDRNVAAVEIEFEKTPFFSGRDNEGATPKRRTRLKDGHGNILGTAPEVGKHGSFSNKYTVRALGSSGRSLGDPYVLDPVIVTCEP